MYESFYQLAANPFRLAPDPNFCFTHPGYQRAREYLEYALAQGEGFVMVTGRPGTGKTMLAETFLQGLDTSQVVAKRITASNYTADDLLRSVAYAYGIDAAGIDKATLRHKIQHYFLEHEQAGRRVLLIIDEAQALQHSALEELRILADLQTQSRLMLQLFLIGQETLQDLMRTPDMEQFQQRVIANYHLVPLNLIEARSYIEYRLVQAGWNGNPAFTGNAVLSIYQLSRGVPRHINKICNRLMLLGYGKGALSLDISDVTAISEEMRNELLAPMDSNGALLNGTDSIATIPELRDGGYTMDDLAITAGNLDDRYSAISEATRQAAQRKAQFNTRHHEDPVSWVEQPGAVMTPAPQSNDVVNKPVAATVESTAENQRQGNAVLGRMLARFRLREAIVVTGATLALTTISIAALPTIMGKLTDQANISQTEPLQQTRDVSVSADDGVEAQLVVTQETTTQPVNKPVDVVTDDAVEATVEPENIQLALAQTTDTLSEDETPIAGLITTGVDQENDTQPDALLAWQSSADALDDSTAESVEQPAVVIDSNQPSDKELALIEGAGSDDSSAKPTDEVGVPESERETRTAYGSIDRQVRVSRQGERLQSDSSESGQLTIARAASEPEMNVVDVRIQELLSQGQRSIDGFRLMTPSGDNAYGYFNAVLALDPDNQAAHKGMQEIVDLYVTLARKAIDKRERARAERYMDRGLSIQPGNRQLLALQSSMKSVSAAAPSVSAGRTVPEGSITAADRGTQNDMMSRITNFFKKRKAEVKRGEIITPAGWDDG